MPVSFLSIQAVAYSCLTQQLTGNPPQALKKDLQKNLVHDAGTLRPTSVSGRQNPLFTSCSRYFTTCFSRNTSSTGSNSPDDWITIHLSLVCSPVMAILKGSFREIRRIRIESLLECVLLISVFNHTRFKGDKRVIRDYLSGARRSVGILAESAQTAPLFCIRLQRKRDNDSKLFDSVSNLHGVTVDAGFFMPQFFP